jgi:hypothetical protein
MGGYLSNTEGASVNIPAGNMSGVCAAASNLREPHRPRPSMQLGEVVPADGAGCASAPHELNASAISALSLPRCHICRTRRRPPTTSPFLRFLCSRPRAPGCTAHGEPDHRELVTRQLKSLADPRLHGMVCCFLTPGGGSQPATEVLTGRRPDGVVD